MSDTGFVSDTGVDTAFTVLDTAVAIQFKLWLTTQVWTVFVTVKPQLWFGVVFLNFSTCAAATGDGCCPPAGNNSIVINK